MTNQNNCNNCRSYRRTCINEYCVTKFTFPAGIPCNNYCTRWKPKFLIHSIWLTLLNGLRQGVRASRGWLIFCGICMVLVALGAPDGQRTEYIEELYLGVILMVCFSILLSLFVIGFIYGVWRKLSKKIDSRGAMEENIGY